MIAMRTILLLVFLGCLGPLAGCIPGESPRHNLLGAAFGGASGGRPGPEVVPVDELSSWFPQSGKYALAQGERDFLKYYMFSRYNEGFYDPDQQEVIAASITEKLNFARSTDNLTLDGLNDLFERDVRANVGVLQDHIIERVQLALDNSVVINTELLQNNPFVDPYSEDGRMMARTVERMLMLRQLVIDELRRREDQNDLDF